MSVNERKFFLQILLKKYLDQDHSVEISARLGSIFIQFEFHGVEFEHVSSSTFTQVF